MNNTTTARKLLRPRTFALLAVASLAVTVVATAQAGADGHERPTGQLMSWFDGDDGCPGCGLG